MLPKLKITKIGTAEIHHYFAYKKYSKRCIFGVRTNKRPLNDLKQGQQRFY